MISVLKMIKFNVASINKCTEVEGPFKRLCIWFQGCNIHCKGCCNPDYQQLVPKNLMTLDVIISIIKEAQKEFGIEGVTFSGGEPSLQQNLPILTSKIKELGLGVISFTGHNYEDVKDCFVDCDVVLDGAYKQAEKEAQRRLLGSKNKRIICLTERYKDCIDTWFNSSETKTMEVSLADKIVINGDAV